MRPIKPAIEAATNAASRVNENRGRIATAAVIGALELTAIQATAPMSAEAESHGGRTPVTHAEHHTAKSKHHHSKHPARKHHRKLHKIVMTRIGDLKPSYLDDEPPTFTAIDTGNSTGEDGSEGASGSQDPSEMSPGGKPNTQSPTPEAAPKITESFDAFADQLMTQDDTQSHKINYVYGTLMIPPLKGGPSTPSVIPVREAAYMRAVDNSGWVFASAFGRKDDASSSPQKLDRDHLQFFYVSNDNLLSLAAYPEGGTGGVTSLTASGTLQYEADLSGNTNGDLFTMQGQRIGIQEFNAPDTTGQTSFYPHQGDMDGSQLYFSPRVAGGK